MQRSTGGGPLVLPDRLMEQSRTFSFVKRKASSTLRSEGTLVIEQWVVHASRVDGRNCR